jgi:hypothetical protein
MEASQVRDHIERLLSFAASEQAKGATLIRWY